MGGRGASGGAVLTSVRSTIERSNTIQDAIRYGARSPFQSAAWVSNLEREISKEAFNRGKEITIKQVDSIVSQLKTHVETERERIRTEKAEEAEKTRQAKEYFARTYNPNREQREITSSTYQRADRALRQQVDNVLGISRKRRRRG